jgi:hypothetical protein
VFTRRKLLTATLASLLIGRTAMAGEWSEIYRAQLRGEAERRRRVRQQRREAVQRRLAEQRERALTREKEPKEKETGDH